MGERLVQATDRGLAQSFGDDIILGSAFAFIGREAFRKPALAWIATLTGGAAADRPRVISLVGRTAVMLPGAIIAPAVIPALSLASVTSDKALYREGRDEVHLLALDPLAAGDGGREAALEIKANGVDFGAHTVRLDARGAAAATLRDLPAGAYEVRFRNAPKDAPACEFTVAEYRLAPLVAQLTDRKLQGERLSVTIRLESFGTPVDGAVQLELMDRDRRIAQARADARGGVCEASFTLTGEGPHAVNVQLAADPSRTATVPIVGSRAAERSKTTLSTLGVEVTGSLLPGEESQPVRGIYLDRGGIRTTPFKLERVDTRRARLVAAAAVESARIVVIDPTATSARAGAADITTAQHPALSDERYRQAESLFQQKRFAESRGAFEAARAAQPVPHPNYAYYIACCHAREGDSDAAVTALREAIRDGWIDLAHLGSDEDLASLRGHAGYEALQAGGRREIVVEDVAAGAAIEVDVPAPIALLAIGAYAGGSPWEGWAAVIAPAAIAPRVEVAERCAPGDDVRIGVDTGGAGDAAAVYVIVKDARLLTPDTPASRLAGGLKAFAEASSKELSVGRPKRTLTAALPPMPVPPPPMAYSAHMPRPAMPGPEIAVARAVAMPRMVSPAPMAPPPPAFGAGPPPPPPGAAPAPRAPYAPAEAPPPPPLGAPAPAAPRQGPYRQAAPPPPPSVEEPEVLFAGLVPTEGGRGAVTVRLGPDFADYVVEAFILSGVEWAPAEARFRAEKDVFVSLDVPAFVHPDDAALARVHVGTRAGARVRVTRDGSDVPLLANGRPFSAGDAVPAGRTEMTFLAGPGVYEARVDDLTGAVERIERRVDVPGKLRRVARGVRFLEPGQRVSRDDDPAILGLRVLPGLEKPFRALTDATADYGHACCEQTAAKLLAACAMYALADADRKRRERAEAIILAGVRREASMWLRGQGFKMYPESAPRPESYWGPMAARHLWNLALLRDLGGPVAPGPALSRAIDEGLEMAGDASRAYRIDWPPARPATAQDAYAAIRFNGKSNPSVGIDFIRQRTAGLAGDALGAGVGRDSAFAGPSAPPSPHFGGAVANRAEAAYCAAGLLRAGGAAERQRALALANGVVQHIGDNGRLYSTVDSVAAIALLAELSAARVVGGAGKVEIDGERLSTAEATGRTAPIRSIQALEGTVAVEVTRAVLEDWSAFDAGLPLFVSLEKNGSPAQRLRALDAVDLRVKLESGYKGGDILWVCLPDALSRVTGGGQVKRFSVDFRGKDEVRIPLAATGVTVSPSGDPGPARFAICVRNMFEEERGGNPGWLDVTVAPPEDGGGGSVIGRALGALKGLLGG